MLISKKLNAAINDEIGLELFASNQYLNMAAYLEGIPLKKLAALFMKQSDEERAHALKFVKYLNDVGGTVTIPAIDAPQATFKSVEEVIAKSLKWEGEVTDRINQMMTMAIAEKDYAAQEFLQWLEGAGRGDVHDGQPPQDREVLWRAGPHHDRGLPLAPGLARRASDRRA